jgi:hypothetical protein
MASMAAGTHLIVPEHLLLEACQLGCVITQLVFDCGA